MTSGVNVSWVMDIESGLAWSSRAWSSISELVDHHDRIGTSEGRKFT